MMAASLSLKCFTCLEDYSDDALPRNLDCGHSVCSLCVQKILNFRAVCPECRQKFEATSVGDLQVNYPILRLSRISAFANLNREVTSLPKLPIRQPEWKPLPSAGTCPAHGCSLFFMCLRCKVMVCRECLATDHPDQPRGLCVVSTIQEGMDRIKMTHRRALEAYLKEAEITKKKLKYIVRGFKALLDYSKRNINGKENQDIDGNLKDISKEIKEAETQLLVVGKLAVIMKETNEMMKEANSWEDIMVATEVCLNCESNFEKNAPREIEPQIFLYPFLKGKKSLKELGKDGKPVYAVLNKDGQSKWSKLVFKNRNILLYSLRDGQRPPADGVTIPFEMLRAVVPQDSPKVFMEVGLRNESKDYIFVHMFGDTPRGQQTVLLCTGELGPSYRNTAIFGFSSEGKDADSLKGGDYENNDGSGGKAIVSNIIHDDIYKHKADYFLFAGWPPEEHWRLGSFSFYIPFRLENEEYIDNVHGRVTRGFGFISNVKYAPCFYMKKPSVIDCGLVIPHDMFDDSEIDDSVDEEM